jgi:hypothetical protein
MKGLDGVKDDEEYANVVGWGSTVQLLEWSPWRNENYEIKLD